ncbi:MAG: endonuclease/exonuclease/phosphatase family protein [Alphaproteobacteria bacterium]
MSFYQWAFAAVTAPLVLLTLAPFSRNRKWWVRIWDFPRLQLATAALFLICLEFVWLDLSQPPAMALVAISAICLVWHGVRIVPYTPLWRTEVPRITGNCPARRLRMLISNVEMTNRNSPALLAIICRQNPDIVLTLESNRWWEEQLAPISKVRPHGFRYAQENTYGMHLFSRLPIEQSQIRFLVEPDVPSIQALVVLQSGHRVHLFCLHPAPPSPTENEESTERDQELSIVAKACAEINAPIIVIGDLNDVAWSRTTRAFRKSSELLDPRRGRGLYNSFHARIPFMRWPLDHVFHSEHFALVHIERLQAIGSDHFPILVELELID